MLSVKPSVRSFLPPIALGAWGVSVAAFAGAALLGTGPAGEVLASVFLLGYLLSTIAWAHLLGREWYLQLLFVYFAALYGAALVQVGATPSGSLVLLLAIELGLFAVMGLLVPVLVSLLLWRNAWYALTDRRAIELWGAVHRTVRDLPLSEVRRVVLRPLGRLGPATVLVLSEGGARGYSAWTGPSAVRRENLGLAFYGVRDGPETAATLERLRTPEPRGPSPPTPSGPSAAGCPRCHTPLVWVAPAGRQYCPNCREYATT